MRPAIAVIVLGSLLRASPAIAETSVHATGDVAIAFNDNIQGAPDAPSADVAPPIADAALSVAPGITLFHAARRWELSLGYGRAFVFFVTHPDADASADQFDAATAIALSPRDDLRLNLGVSRFSNNLSTLSAPSATTAAAQQQGDFQVLRANLSQQYQHAYTNRWTLEQTGSATVNASPDTNDGNTISANVALGPTWEARDHIVAARLGVQHLHNLGRELDDGTVLPSADQITPQALLRWRNTLAERWASELRGGIATPFDLDRNVLVVPLAGAALHYTNEDYFAKLAYSRDVAATITTGEAFESDSGSLSGSVPLWRRGGLGLEGAVSIANNRLVGATLEGAPLAVNNWAVDVGLLWAMRSLPVSVALRYQRLQQFGAPPDQTRLFDFTRNVATLSLGYFIPPRAW